MRTRTSGNMNLISIPGGSYTSFDRNGVKLDTVKAPSFRYRPGMVITTDEVHPTHPYDGGPFLLRKAVARLHPQMVSTRFANSTVDTQYDLVRIVHNESILPATPPQSDDCSSLGPSAWNKFKPKVTTVSLGQFIAELKDAPSLFRFQLKRFKDLGSLYLNAQFGWKPFLSDLRKWYQSIIRLDHQLHKLQKKSNVWQRRSGTISETETTTTGPAAELWNTNLIGKINASSEIRTYEKSWFSGSFRYYVPNLSNGDWGTVRSLKKLWGLEVTPSLVYELLPYSWLLDWFSNVGDVIGNYTSITNDNMAARYAFVMRHRRTIYDLKYEGLASYTKLGPGRIPVTTYSIVNLSSTYEVETKSRVEASPYGFSLGWADFNPYQLSILAALGISRS